MKHLIVNLVALKIGLERGRLLKRELLDFCKTSSDVQTWKLFVLRNKNDRRIYLDKNNKPMFFWNRLYAVEAAKEINKKDPIVFVSKGPDHYYYTKIHQEDPEPQNFRRKR